MLKKTIIFIIFALLNINSVMAGDLLLKVTPIHILTTCKKNFFEGDDVIFKIAEDNAEFKKDDIITGTILKYKQNGFNGEEANLTIGNFRKADGKKFNGSLYISGNQHETYQEYMNGTTSDFLAMPIIRGGEVKVKPDQLLTVIINNKEQTEEVIPVKIKPAQTISTCNNEIQINDIIRFKTVNDIFVENNLYIKKDTPIIGYVDYVQENGWDYDNAQIDIKKFKTRDVNGNLIEINSELSINGFEILKYKGNRKAQFFNYIGVYFRGKEIEIIPEKDKNIIFNIWLTK